ncbi:MULTISPECIES: amidophosphoribosyltransferase [unclassified Streptomyces]|uniref:amidophosphoribosyltransferase n=1 Tax=unclassified Streptomyces TaxID=2593676 RepID=UPI00168AF88F|nr:MULTISPECIES: amidophosphoribosyltransferase [unclassified Streptomyces]MBD3007221.1 amidophosphoribosyltransferase [Streptomyces sp. 5-10]
MNDPLAKPRESCGVTGTWGPATPVLRTMMIALQHRGQQSAGIAACRGTGIGCRTGSGRVTDVFPDAHPRVLHDAHGAVGHVRYATSGADGPDDGSAQPILLDSCAGPVCLAHNGTLVNTGDARTELGIPAGATDTAVLGRLLTAAMEQRGVTLSEALHVVLPRITGAYSLVLTDGRRLYGVRDPQAFRPLCLGRLDDTWLLASESAAVTAVGGTFVRELEAGEVLEIGAAGFRSSRLDVPGARRASCLFEHVYFARADSRIDGRSVYEARYAAGRALARHAPPPAGADAVVAVPDTARVAADGYAWQAGLPSVQGLLRHEGVGRSFITAGPAGRATAVRQKLSAVPAAVEERSVVLVDDSLVRGTTMTAVVAMLREAGVRAVHLRIASPPHRWPCFYGIDTGRGDALVGARFAPDRLAAHLGCDSAGFLPLDALLGAVGGAADSYCTACLDGRFPTAVELPDGAVLQRQP